MHPAEFLALLDERLDSGDGRRYPTLDEWTVAIAEVRKAAESLSIPVPAACSALKVQIVGDYGGDACQWHYTPRSQYETSDGHWRVTQRPQPQYQPDEHVVGPAEQSYADWVAAGERRRTKQS